MRGELKELLSSELDKLGFKADRVDYTKPLAFITELLHNIMDE